jgi:hypothetical protein
VHLSPLRSGLPASLHLTSPHSTPLHSTPHRFTSLHCTSRRKRCAWCCCATPTWWPSTAAAWMAPAASCSASSAKVGPGARRGAWAASGKLQQSGNRGWLRQQAAASPRRQLSWPGLKWDRVVRWKCCRLLMPRCARCQRLLPAVDRAHRLETQPAFCLALPAPLPPSTAGLSRYFRGGVLWHRLTSPRWPPPHPPPHRRRPAQCASADRSRILAAPVWVAPARAEGGARGCPCPQLPPHQGKRCFCLLHRPPVNCKWVSGPPARSRRATAAAAAGPLLLHTRGRSRAT